MDFMIDGLRKGDHERNRLDDLLLEIGAYVGEVLVRQAGAVWIDFDGEQTVFFKQPVGVLMPDGRVWSPLGRVVNRFEVGNEASLRDFFLTLPGRRRRALSGRPQRPPSTACTERGESGRWGIPRPGVPGCAH
ncbi:hypothetical protein [Streptomyces sp. AC602_WCS936]|uniref:hypothetical protein n=1 Tax=Streptomyces sp. AC602_WCS936 TaxID=2823685 RepID=UPI0035B11782